MFSVIVSIVVVLCLGCFQATYAQRPCSVGLCRAGECEQTKTGFVCHCEDKVKGEFCDRLLTTNDNICLTKPCWNDATCIGNQANTDFNCVCKPGFSGKNCKAIETIPCKNVRCQNGGICRVVNDIETCFCINEFFGEFCEKTNSFCDKPYPCFNGGKCINNACVCFANFTGSQCQTYVSPSLDRFVKVKNKGWYTADVYLTYILKGETKVLGKSLLAPQEHTFRYEFGASKVVLDVYAIGGVTVLKNEQITSSPQCYHVWGTTLFPSKSRIDCW